MLNLIKTNDKTNIDIFLLATVGIGIEVKSYDGVFGYLTAIHKTFQIDNMYVMCVASVLNPTKQTQLQIQFEFNAYDAQLTRFAKTKWLNSFTVAKSAKNCTWLDIVDGFCAQPQLMGASTVDTKVPYSHIPYNEMQLLRDAKSINLGTF